MDLNRPNRIDELFHQAADLSLAERSAFLERACAGDDELRQELESLLAADATQDGFLRAAVDQALEQLPITTKENSEPLGQRVGRYTITGLIGQGGMGAVYRAVRTDDFRMEVALKFLKHGTDTEAALSRFRSERQILANLQHPHIARLLDGGSTEAGLPYFVMEYVDGTPLLDYAAPLSIRQHLELFCSICSAVQYAHQHRVIHRDIKPANILVTREGTPKLLDFGIAKLVDPAAKDAGGATLTAAGLRVMTPDYASPEQVRGEPITAATDIYQLGAVLYELLTGQRAHHIETCSPSEIEREICLHEPRKPSAVVPHLDPDLDNIVLKALRKEPERRYASVQDLIDDLDRFLHDLPVQARPESLLYRGRKFLKRNRTLLTATTLTSLMVLVLVAGLSWLTKKIGTESSIRSIAVLPLENLSGNKEQEYFADGITDALISELARIRALRVTSRTSAMSYKNVHRSLPEIARTLRVQTIAEGSVLRAGNRVRIAIRLIDVPTERSIWSGSYEGELKEVLELQAQVVEAISGEIHVTLTAPDQARLSRNQRIDLSAYDAYLRARQLYFSGFTEEGVQKAISYFHRALAIDPSFAPAYAGLADAYFGLSNIYYPPKQAMPKAKAAALKALELDEMLGEAHAMLAMVRSVYEFDRAEAEKEFKRAIELKPSNAEVHLWYGQHLAGMGKFDEAVAEVQQAAKLDPISPAIDAYAGLTLFLAHRYDEVIQRLQPIAEMHPDYHHPHAFLGLAYEQKREWARAIAEMERAYELDREPEALAQLGHIYAVAGRKPEARRMLRELKALSRQRYVSVYNIAILSAGLGEKDEAFRWLAKWEEDRSEWFAAVNVDPRLDHLHADPRFAGLLRSVGLKQSAH